MNRARQASAWCAHTWLVVLGAVAAVASCPAETSAETTTETTTETTRATTTATAADDPGATVSAPAGELTLEDALAATLRGSPELAAFSWEIRAREADALQARARPNPELAVELENFAGSGEARGVDALEGTVGLSQTFELGGKRGKREMLAEQERSLAQWDYEAARIDVIAETKRAFFHVLAAQEELALADELAAVAQQVLDAVARRVTAGAASPVEESRARVELETTRIDREHAALALGTARGRLVALWGDRAPAFERAAGEIEEIAPTPSLASLQEEVGGNPAVARWSTELAHREAALALERSLGVPDLTLGSGLRYLGDSDDVALLVELSVPLPLRDRNRGASQAAELRMRRAEEERRAGVVAVEAELLAWHQELLEAASEVEALRDRVLPEAARTFEAAHEAYLRGGMRLTDVLDSERLLFELRSRYVAALLRHHVARAELERLTGGAIESMGRR